MVDSSNSHNNNTLSSDSYRRAVICARICVSNGVRMLLKSITERVARIFKRFNQLVLVFPIWIILGFSGFFRTKTKKSGWIESSTNKKYEKMY